MKTNTSSKMVWAKSLILLPLLAVLVYSFSTQETLLKSGSGDFEQKGNFAILPSGDTIVITEDINIRMISEEQLLFNGNTISYDELPGMLDQLNSHIPPEERGKMISAEISTTKEFPVGWVNDVKRSLYHYGITRPKVTLIGIPENGGEEVQEKATQAMLKEYDRLVKHYNSENNSTIKNEDLQRMNYIYSVMTPQQREKAEKRKFKVPPVRTDEKPASSKKSNRLIFEADTLIFREDDNKAKSSNFRAGSMKFSDPSVSPPPPPPAPPTPKEGEIPLPPPPPPVPQNIDVPMPPPPPPSPIEAVKGWIEEGAEFYLNGNKVTGEKALEVVKENNGKNLSVQVEENASGKTVRLSDNKR